MRKCIKCGEVKEISKFYNHKIFSDGKSSQCKHCIDVGHRNLRRTKPGLIGYMFSNQGQSSKQRSHLMPTYSLTELREWCYSQKIFHELYDNWKDAGYIKDLIPSCDRIDDYKSYTLANIILTTWKENKIRGWRDRKAGINNKHSKSVIGIHKDTGERIEFYSAIEAYRNTGIRYSNISECCRGIRKSAGRYVWKFDEQLN